MSALAGQMAMFTKEPVTESGLRLREQELRAERLTVAQAEEMLAERHEAWTPADYDQEEEEEDVVTDAAWTRVLRGKKRRLAEAIAAGELHASGKGTRARLRRHPRRPWRRRTPWRRHPRKQQLRPQRVQLAPRWSSGCLTTRLPVRAERPSVQ
ncbi:MAG: hypothetical protein M3P30_14905 [Chloroflexota bacterium]|nr:hypothetical protein [Chloroflexota bacterium]